MDPNTAYITTYIAYWGSLVASVAANTLVMNIVWMIVAVIFLTMLFAQFSSTKRMERNIGMLRQWLNEDRITDPQKTVSSEQIKVWLEL